MPPNLLFTKEYVVNKVFDLTQKININDITARKIARTLKTSTSPIYSFFDSIDELKLEVMKKGLSILLEYTKREYTEDYHVNIGMGFVSFARDYSNIFQAMFMENNHYKSIIDEFENHIVELFEKDTLYTSFDQKGIKDVVRKLRVFAHGLACLLTVKLIEIKNETELAKMISDVGYSVYTASLNQISGNGREAVFEQFSSMSINAAN